MRTRCCKVGRNGMSTCGGSDMRYDRFTAYLAKGRTLSDDPHPFVQLPPGRGESFGPFYAPIAARYHAGMKAVLKTIVVVGAGAMAALMAFAAGDIAKVFVPTAEAQTLIDMLFNFAVMPIAVVA